MAAPMTARLSPAEAELAHYHRILSTLNFSASILIAAIMLVITADVAGRAFFGQPLHGIPELTKFSVVCMVWLQMAYTLRTGKHLRSTLLLNMMGDAGRRSVLVLNCVLGAILMLLIAYYSYPEMLRSWRIGAFEGEHPVRIPTWPIWAIVVGGSALTAVEYARQAVSLILGRDDVEVDA